MIKISSSIRKRSSPQSETMITSFIDTHPQGVITSITPEGILQSSVVKIYEPKELQFCFMTKKGTRKHVNLTKNPTVSFLTYSPFHRTEAEIEGVAIEVRDSKEIETILKTIRFDSKLGSWHISPYVSEKDDFVLFTIYPRKMHMTTYWEIDGAIEVFHETTEFDLKMKS